MYYVVVSERNTERELVAQQQRRIGELEQELAAKTRQINELLERRHTAAAVVVKNGDSSSFAKNGDSFA